MSAYYNVILIRDKNISERYSIQPLAMSAKCDYSLTHLIAITLIHHLGIGEHLECRFSCPEFIQFVGYFIVVTFGSPNVFDHTSVRLELLLRFPFVTYDPRVTRTVFAILWHEILPSWRLVNSDQCLIPVHFQQSSVFLPNPWDLRVELTCGIRSWISTSGCEGHAPVVECNGHPSLPP